jgi:hypothetical protein
MTPAATLLLGVPERTVMRGSWAGRTRAMAARTYTVASKCNRVCNHDGSNSPVAMDVDGAQA